jgi:hypothetical protein
MTTTRASSQLIKKLWEYESFYGARDFVTNNRLFDQRDIKQLIKDRFVSPSEAETIRDARGIVLRGSRNASIFSNNDIMRDAWKKMKERENESHRSS